MKQEKYELIITADSITSTDERFTMDNLFIGDNYKPLDVYFKAANGNVIRRNYNKRERRNSNQTLPRIACQIFESQLAALSIEDKENFPICRYTPDKNVFRGIFSSVDEFKKYLNTIEYLTYNRDNGKQFVIYCWNVFSTLMFTQECLKRFGKKGDQFVLIYRENEEAETAAAKSENETVISEEPVRQFNGYRNPYSAMLIKSKNIILRGAPGTGKTYLAKEIAADIISKGAASYAELSQEQKKQVEFVQFHPSYDYSDFVEGLRPILNDDGTMIFELQDGIFKKFVARAGENYENSKKSKEKARGENQKNYIFIIDEINRGEISKIFGELFFAVDPGYRGRDGEVSTQYANLHFNPDEKFYIPKNVYIIGTMNDIDRSVDSFDFAMRRRFRFIELKADEHTEMLASLEDEKSETEAKKRMKALNKKIAETDGLNENYQIGAAYFLKLKTLTFDELWTDYLKPLLQDYINGMSNEADIMKGFEEAYGYKEPSEGNPDEAAEN